MSDLTTQQDKSALFDPRFWLSVMGFLWLISTAVVGSIWIKLNSIETNITALSVQNAAEVQKRIEMERRITALETFKDNQMAYNYDQGKMLTKIQTQLQSKGVK